MSYRISVSTPLQWVVGDKPDIDGRVVGTLPDLIGVTARLTRPYTTDLIQEQLVTFSPPDEFRLVSPVLFNRPDSGVLIVSLLVDRQGRAELAGNINSTVTTIIVFNESGPIQNSGYLKLNSEIMFYTKSGSMLTVQRGVLQTDSAAHTSGDTIEFIDAKESALPYIPYKVLRTDTLGGPFF